MKLTHSENCKTEDKDFVGTLGATDYSGPDEYRINVSKDVITFEDRTETFYSAEITVGRRWDSHITISFHDELSGDKTLLLYGMRQMKTDLEDAISYLEGL